jgi:predicted short-subunit dehydrogenase-like oxidoreductase (DUF2520 family)
MGNKIGIIGAGNLAWHLAKMFSLHKVELQSIFVRSVSQVIDFQFLNETVFYHQIPQLIAKSEIIFFAVPDKTIAELLRDYQWHNKYLVHSAGSVSIDVFRHRTENFGVFYPMQTFTKNRMLDYAEIPIFVEANSSRNEQILVNLASKISTKTMILDSEKRKQMHLAAVFVNNFANRMWSIGQELCAENDIPFEYLQALLQETYLKALENSALNSQTGPAKRQDYQTMQLHLEMLKNKALLKKIYSFVSESIIQTQKNA